MNKLSLVGIELPENIRRVSTFRANAIRVEFLADYTMLLNDNV